MKKIFVILGLITFTNACTKKVVAKKDQVVIDTPIQKSQITPEIIVEGSLYGAGSENIAQQNTVITDQATWDALVVQMNSANNFFTSPVIDFTTHKVIAVFTDIKGNGGWSVAISNIEQTVTEIQVTKTETSPGEIATTVITQPFSIVKIPTSSLPITFN